MFGYPRPYNEAARLEALRRYAILDSAPEDPYDNLVQVAANLCEVPVAAVSLVDKDRQWFKARQGIAATETPREWAFCAHAIMGNETFIVEDATQDERFSSNPLVTGEPDIRFYMGAPLVTSEGLALGSFCVIDHKPRHLSSEQRQALEALRNVAVYLIEQRNVTRQLADALAKVRQLRGLLPICSYCKNVRNDQGYWDEIGQYIAEHTEAELTHGICPDCLEKNFPEYADQRPDGDAPQSSTNTTGS